MEQPSDAELMRRTRSGDDEAFTTLVGRYKHSLVNYLTNLTGSRERAEDLAQEAMVRLYCGARNYDERGKLAPYLFRIGTNLVRSENRRSRRWAVVALFVSTGEEDALTPHALLARDEIHRQVRSALASLPLVYRAPLVLREIEEWTYQEIAESLGWREGTVKSRISRGREQLRRILSAYWVRGETIDEGPTARASVGTPS